MAKKRGKFEVDVISKDKAQEELSELRSGRGGRTSKYAPVAEEVQNLKEDRVLKLELKKNEVGGLRGYLRRRFGEKYTVKSSKIEGERYMAFVFLTSEEDA